LAPSASEITEGFIAFELNVKKGACVVHRS
jgi:hypothetical protein